MFIYLNGLCFISTVSYVAKRRSHTNEYWFCKLLYTHLKERRYDSIYQNTKQDADYLKFPQQEQELCSQYESLYLSDDQRKVILDWIDTIYAKKWSLYNGCFSYGNAVLLFDSSGTNGFEITNVHIVKKPAVNRMIILAGFYQTSFFQIFLF